MPFAEPMHFVRAADAVGDVIAAVADEQWTIPTPCQEWNVAQVVGHLIDVNERFAPQLGAPGTVVSPGSTDRACSDDPVDRYRASTERLHDDLCSAEAAGGLSTQLRGRLALRVADLLIHGWDIATATGQSVQLPEDLTALALEFTLSRLAALQRSGQFAHPQTVGRNASVIDCLAALSGRRVTLWRSLYADAS
jgi:uncharacterized protein (TIGR03086 family)